MPFGWEYVIVMQIKKAFDRREGGAWRAARLGLRIEWSIGSPLAGRPVLTTNASETA